MTKSFPVSFFSLLLWFSSCGLLAQNVIPFGNITLEELSNKPYIPDPGADAIYLSDVGIVTLNYDGEFYVELERDVRIRIVNSNGFDYANIEIPFSSYDMLINYKASTFNIRNGEKTETKVLRKSFINENSANYYRTLKFNFPDVHEGSVIEYSYMIRFKNSAVNILVPWAFQSDIPVILSSLTVKYPNNFKYKTTITGSSKSIESRIIVDDAMFLGESVQINTITWSARDLPAFRDEPFILSRKEHLTKISFELSRVDFFNSPLVKEITPSYKTLTEKLLERYDFGFPLNANFKVLAEKITKDQKDDLSKVKKIHEYISSNILWNGEEDFTTSSSQSYVMRKEKGNSADINILLIAMLKSLGIKADPVILSTRSNGSLNQNSAILQQFNYIIANVSVNGESYLVDATDPLHPFNQLPFYCLNKAGRLISENDSRFVDLKNNERFNNTVNINYTIDSTGVVSGDLEHNYSDYSAYDIRKIVKLESEEGYLDIVKSYTGNAEISDFKFQNLMDPDSDLSLKYRFKINNGAQIAGDEIVFNPYQLETEIKNSFFNPERKFPIDFGCPRSNNFSMKLDIPDGYSVIEKPEDCTLNLGTDGGKFEFSCTQKGKVVEMKSNANIVKTVFQPSDYSLIQKFYLKIQQKQAEYIVLRKKSSINQNK